VEYSTIPPPAQKATGAFSPVRSVDGFPAAATRPGLPRAGGARLARG